MIPPTLIDKAFLLKTTSLFSSLDLDTLLPIAEKLGVVGFNEGETIFHRDSEVARLYFIISGKVTIETGTEQVVLQTGEVFGDEAILGDSKRRYDACAAEKTMLLTLNRTSLLTVMSECPAVAINLLTDYAAVTPFRQRKG